MSAAKRKRRSAAKRRRRAVKPTLVRGHELSAEQVKEFEHRVGDVGRRFPEWTGEQRVSRALDDMLYPYTPGKRVKRRLLDIFGRATQAGMAAASLCDYQWITEPAISGAGCTLLRQLARECDRTGAMLREIASGLEGQAAGSKLQDWAAHDARLASIEAHDIQHGGQS